MVFKSSRQADYSTKDGQLYIPYFIYDEGSYDFKHLGHYHERQLNVCCIYGNLEIPMVLGFLPI
jgi:hypothetical protein